MGVEWDVEGIVVVQLFVRQNAATEVLGILHTDMSSPASKDTHTSQVLPKHTCTQTCKHRQRKHTHTHTHTHTHSTSHTGHNISMVKAHTEIHTHTHVCTHTHTHMRAHTHGCAHTHTHTHMRTHTHTNIPKHIQILQHGTHTHLSHVCSCWVTKSKIITTKDDEGTALTEKALTGPHFCRPP